MNNPLGYLSRIPGLFRAYSLPEAAPRLIHSHQLSCKDVTTNRGGDNENDSKLDTLLPHTTQTSGLQDSKINKQPSSIEKFQIYKTVPPEIHELFLKTNERLRYRKLNEMFKKEMDQVILKETLPNNGHDGSKMTPVALKRNAIYDAQLDNIVKNLLSETRSVIKKMTRQASQHGVSKSFDGKTRTMLAEKDTAACDFKPGTNSRGSEKSGGSDGNSSSHSGSTPPPTSSDVIVSPYIDEKGNIDYTRAVIKSSGSDTAAADILKRLIQDPVKPLPTFQLPDLQRHTETVLLRSDGTQETIGDGTSSYTFTRQESTCEPTKLSSESKSKSADSVPSTMKVGSRLATSKDEKPKVVFSDCTSKVTGKKSSYLEKKSGTGGSHLGKDKCKDKEKSSKSPKLSSSRKSDDACKHPVKVQTTVKTEDCKQAKTPVALMTTGNVVKEAAKQQGTKSKCSQQKHLGKKSKVHDSKQNDNKKKESDKPHIEPDGECG